LPAVAKGVLAFALQGAFGETPNVATEDGRAPHFRWQGASNRTRGRPAKRDETLCQRTYLRQGYGRQARYCKPSAWRHTTPFYQNWGQGHSSSLPQSNAFVANAKLWDLRCVIDEICGAE
jgi:hypothetical protein